MRIMQIISGTGVNGAIIHCMLLSRELTRRGHKVMLLCRPEAWIARQLASDPVEIIESTLQRWPMKELRRVAKTIEEKQIDVVHTHMSSAHFFGVLLRLFSPIPCVATAHSRRFQLHWMFNDHVIANSSATLQYHRQKNLVRRNRISTVHCFIDQEKFTKIADESREEIRVELNLPSTCPVLGVIGTLLPLKGQIHLVRALPQILTVNPQARLLIIGSEGTAYARQVREEAEQLHLTEHITWTGHRDDVPRLMNAMDICVSASLEESLGLTALEAMAAGLPVVACRVGGLPECVICGETGLLVPPADPAALAEAINELLNNPSMRSEFGAAGKKRVQEYFSPESQTALVENVFSQTIKRNKAA